MFLAVSLRNAAAILLLHGEGPEIEVMLRTAEDKVGGTWADGIPEPLVVHAFHSMSFKPVWASVLCLLKLRSFWQIHLFIKLLMAMTATLKFFPGIPCESVGSNRKLNTAFLWFTGLPPPVLQAYSANARADPSRKACQHSSGVHSWITTLVWEGHPLNISRQKIWGRVHTRVSSFQQSPWLSLALAHTFNYCVYTYIFMYVWPLLYLYFIWNY